MFEVITSEASYLKSLDILISHFMLDKDLLPNPNLPASEPPSNTATAIMGTMGGTVLPPAEGLTQILDRQQYHFLFSGLSSIKGVSERYGKDMKIFHIL